MNRLLLVATLVLLPVTASAQQAETIEYYGTDAIGSIRIVWDANGNMIARQDFTPFGEPVLQQGTAIPKEGFVGNESDAETNQDYFHARMFEARTGRFTRTDPVEDGLGEPQRWNRYAYGLNHPLSFVDANGLQADACDGTDYNTGTCVTGRYVDPTWDSDSSDPCGWWGCDGEGGGPSGDGEGGGGGGGQTQSTTKTNGTQTGGTGTDGGNGNNNGDGNNNGNNNGGTDCDPKTGANCNRPTNPRKCARSGFAPPPSFYAGLGQSSGLFDNDVNLFEFHRGGALDAQVRYGGSPAYANYTYGVYMAASGYSLSFTLGGANFYGSHFSNYHGQSMDPTYGALPQENVDNIKAGFNDFRNASLCTIF